MLFLPALILYDLENTVLPKTFLTVRIIEESRVELKVILVEFVNGLGAVDKLSTDFSCEKPIKETDKSKIKSNFLIIHLLF